MVAGPLFQCNAGVKQLYRQLISLFQSMPEHFCAQASSTRNSRRRFLVDIRGCLCSGTNIRSEKYRINDIFHSSHFIDGVDNQGRGMHLSGVLKPALLTPFSGLVHLDDGLLNEQRGASEDPSLLASLTNPYCLLVSSFHKW